MVLSCPFCREKSAKGRRECPKCKHVIARPCPYCEEEISVLAELCKYCGEGVDPRPDAVEPKPAQPDIVFLDEQPKKRRFCGLGVVAFLAAAAAAAATVLMFL